MFYKTVKVCYMKLFEANTRVYILCLMLVTLCGCWPFDKKDDASQDYSSGSAATSLADDVLMTVDGDVVLTVKEYEELVDMIRQSNQQFAMMIEMMPDAEKDFVFKGISTSKLMKAWAQKNGVDKTEEFIREQQQAHDSIDLQLYMKYYDEAHPVHIGEKEIKKFYEENKASIPQLVVSPGGVACDYVRFDKELDAKDFYNAVKGKSEEVFAQEAEARYAKVQEALVNQASQHSQVVRKFAERVKKMPHVEVVKVSDNSYWVIRANSKEKAEYRPLDSPGIKDGLRKMMVNDKKEAELEGNMDALKKEMNVVENHAYFEKKAALKQQEREEDMATQDAQHRMNYGKMQQELEKEEEYNNAVSKL